MFKNVSDAIALEACFNMWKDDDPRMELIVSVKEAFMDIVYHGLMAEAVMVALGNPQPNMIN